MEALERSRAMPNGLVAFDFAHASPTANPLLLWRFEKGFEMVIPSPLLHQGILYSVKNGGILTAFDAKTGEVTKTGRIPGALGAIPLRQCSPRGGSISRVKRERSPSSAQAENGS